MNNEPKEITAGDSLSWTKTLSDYSVADGWVLKYAGRGPSAFDITATGAGTDHQIEVLPADTSSWSPGLYSVQGYVEKETPPARVTVYRGELLVRPDLVGAAAGYDGRTHARKTLDAIEALIEGRASKAQKRHKVDDTELEFFSFAELLQLRNRYRAEVRREARAAKRQNGGKAGTFVKFRF